MDSSEMTKAQAKVLHTALMPTLGYLSRLQARLKHLGFPRDDKVYALVADTQDQMHRLCVELHYIACRLDLGGPDNKK